MHDTLKTTWAKLSRFLFVNYDKIEQPKIEVGILAQYATESIEVSFTFNGQDYFCIINEYDKPFALNIHSGFGLDKVILCPSVDSLIKEFEAII